MEFYVYLNGARRGPFTEERVQSFLSEGLLHPSDLASDQPESGWRQLSGFRRFTSVEPDAPAVAPAVSALPPPLPVTAPSPAIRQAVAEVSSAAAPIKRRPFPAEALGSYARATLAPNEAPFYKTSLHWIIFVRYAALGLLIFLLAAIPFAIAVQALTGSEIGWFTLPLPTFIMLPPALAFASSELVITDRRVLIKTGVIRRQSIEMFISMIESVAVDQGFFGRLFDFGTVTIRGTGGFEEPFETIANPILFRNWVQRLQSGDASASSGQAPR